MMRDQLGLVLGDFRDLTSEGFRDFWHEARVSARRPMLASMNKSMKDIAAAIEPGTAALFVLVRKVTTDKVLEGVKVKAVPY